jgi:hypothetical protein
MSYSPEKVNNDALDRCARELQRFIDLAKDYDLDEMSVQALQTSIEALQFWKAATLRQQAARVDDDAVARAYNALDRYVDEHAGGDVGLLDDGQWNDALRAALEAALSAQPAERQGEAVAWLHTVTQGDGETDQALSFSPDSFPLDTQLGFRSLGCRPLGYIDTHPAAPMGVPAEPDQALLASMAICLRHDFGLLDAKQQSSMLNDMRKLWDEVVGRGYYRPENRERYLAFLVAPSAPQGA